MDYLVTGLNMMDVSVYNGIRNRGQIGGIPTYGYCGIAVYTDSIDYVARVGNDFFDYYGKWFEQNRINTDGLRFVSDKTPYAMLNYGEDGAIKSWDFFTGSWNDAEFFRPKKTDIISRITSETKGFYISGGPEPDEVWQSVFDMRNNGCDFSVMWEPNGINTVPEKKYAILELMKKIEMASFSLVEGLRIFGLNTEAELIEFLRLQPTQIIILRVGARGLYTITKDQIVFVPSAPLPNGEKVVDVTGCGNASTAAACYAWCEGYDQTMTGIMANVASMYNLLQFGPFPNFTPAMRRDAMNLANDLYDSGKYTVIDDIQNFTNKRRNNHGKIRQQSSQGNIQSSDYDEVYLQRYSK